MSASEKSSSAGINLDLNRDSVLRDYRLAIQSREASVIGRREVLSGKAKFGIFGDGKEVPQLAMARAFQPGDIRSGYYRDQTLMLSLGMLSLEEFFAQLYGDTDVQRNEASAGRMMNAHFGTRMLNDDGSWKDLTRDPHSSADLSPVSAQMGRVVGHGYASRLYRELEALRSFTGFSNSGNEIAFATIGNGGCAEGIFWEALNAVGVLRAPVLISVWDDGYGISVPNEYQLAKPDLTTLLEGFRRSRDVREGFDLYRVQGWDYPALCGTYLRAAEVMRREHVPAVIHVTEVTQPQGHSTSGSHERYKSKERLQWEQEFDCITRMRQWVIHERLATAEELDDLEKESREQVREIRRQTWEEYHQPIEEELRKVVEWVTRIAESSADGQELRAIVKRLGRLPVAHLRDLMAAAKEVLIAARNQDSPTAQELADWQKEQALRAEERYSSHVYSASPQSALKVRENRPVYTDDSPTVNGYEVLNACFDAALEKYPNLIAFGEDLGKLGDVNQAFAGLQAKYGELRVSDTGIREATIVGQAIGMAQRGLRPIAEIQYLDYLPYALQIMSDDLASLHWRTKGGQKAPVIVRTRGHRLEGVWHSGSHMAGILNHLRGMFICVPRNMTQAAGFYNTLLQSDDAALVVEVLNGYRRKERLPANIGDLTVPLGVPEVLRRGTDVTVVTYGACCAIALDAAELLSRVEIEAEILDVQTLLPFDISGEITVSIRKTNRVVFVDEDVPGGTTAYMMQKVLEEQGGYHWLDSEPRTLSAKEHRPAYGSDGDYFSKPNREQIFEVVYELLHEAEPERFPDFYR